MARQVNQPELCAARLRRLSRTRPELGIILGSGFRHVLTNTDEEAGVSYKDLSGFPRAGVPGHEGRVVFGTLGGTSVVILSGRAHFYEGYSMSEVTFGVRVLAALGVRDLLLTNAAGGVNAKLRPGDFMVITDHINFMGTNPLVGAGHPKLARFVDLSVAYDPGLRRLLSEAGRLTKMALQKGVYLSVCGPSYETPAEIRAFSRLGADAVGMSTVPEAIVARHCGLRVAGVSCITNLAAGRSRKPLSHAEVIAVGEKVRDHSAALIRNFAFLYGRQGQR